VTARYLGLHGGFPVITSYAVKVHYLDASALVKLVADDPDEEPGRDVLRQYYWGHSNRYATSYCVTETFSAFKGKFRNHKITEDQYIKYVKEFIHGYIGASLKIDEVPILKPLVIPEAERLFQKYKIDFIDCFQIVTILHGQFRFLCLDSKSILITADHALAEAARAEDARVWEVTTDPVPPD
jgi:predicted nucleic acid-binding protein